MECDHVVVVIFVNRLEFSDEESYKEFPRNESSDIETLRNFKFVDVLFLPKEEEFYHRGNIKGAVISYNGGLGDVYEMQRRPYKFSGLATVITKLVGIVQPTQIYVGRNCVQTERLLRLLLEDLLIPVEVVGVPALRGPDGLFYDSMTQLMNSEDLDLAKLIFPTLKTLIKQYLEGEFRTSKLLWTLKNELERPELIVDYLAIVDEETFEAINEIDYKKGALVIIGVNIRGRFQLMDNVILAPCKPQKPNWFNKLFKTKR